MQKFLTACALVLLTATAVMGQPAQTLANSVGQPVYDLTNMKVGVIQGVTSELGSPYAIVAISNIGRASPANGDYRVLIPQESIQPRTGGVAGRAQVGFDSPSVPLRARHDAARLKHFGPAPLQAKWRAAVCTCLLGERDGYAADIPSAINAGYFTALTRTNSGFSALATPWSPGVSYWRYAGIWSRRTKL